MINPAIIKAAARALACLPGNDELHLDLAMRVLTAVAPMIEAAALERAAKIVEDEHGNYSWHQDATLLKQHGRELAYAIRALKDKS